MMDTTVLLWGFFFSTIGLAFFVYGKKQRSITPLLSGIGLMIFPYMVENVYLLVAIGVGLVCLPFFIRE